MYPVAGENPHEQGKPDAGHQQAGRQDSIGPDPSEDPRADSGACDARGCHGQVAKPGSNCREVQYVLHVQGEEEEHGEDASSDQEHTYICRDQSATPKQARRHEWVTAHLHTDGWALSGRSGPREGNCDRQDL